MDNRKLTELQIFAETIRIETLKEMAEIGNGHVGGALDMAELLAVLYKDVMQINPKNPDDPDRDYLVVSKGHAGPVIYATLALMGYFPMEQLKTLNQPGTKLPSHCDRRKTVGIDMTAGSLGQGIGAAVGIALGNKTAGCSNHTFCVVGDGEMDEGSVWEAMLIAPQFMLENLTVIVDNNGLQIDGFTNDIVNLGDISQKAKDFGWYTIDVDGHDIASLSDAIALAKKSAQPSFINMHTVKAKGWKKYENIAGCHHVKSITKDDIATPIIELENKIANIKVNV